MPYPNTCISTLFLWLLLVGPALLYAQSNDSQYIIQEADTLNDTHFYLVDSQNIPSEKVIRQWGDKVIVKGKDAKYADRAYALSERWKLSGKLPTARYQRGTYYVRLYDGRKGLSTSENLSVKSTADSTLILVEGTPEEVTQQLLPDGNVVFIQPVNRSPQVEARIRQHDLSANAINLVHHAYPQLRGQGLHASVKENTFDRTDADLAGRAVVDSNASAMIDRHATEMATLLGGAGYTDVSGRGVADRATLHATDFVSLMPESEAYYRTRGITVQNHSYGTQVENFYGVESAAYDALAQEYPSLLHVFSIGNQGEQEATGPYEGVSSYATITGSFKQAKNVMLVSSTDSLGRVAARNSRGPAYDGRIKPDLVAFGGGGTSEAAALVSGSALLLQEHYQALVGELPTAAMVRALLIAGSDDILEEGPDLISGYGQLNLFRSLQILDRQAFSTGQVTAGGTQRFTVTIPEGTAAINWVLNWSDPPGREGSDLALINDLDLSIRQGERVFLPWVLDTAPNEASLARPATTGTDHRNNVEMITLKNPPAGEYTVTISGTSVSGTQPYALAYCTTAARSFRWSSPSGSDPVRAHQPGKVRWLTSIAGTGTLEIDYLNEQWKVLKEVSLADGIAEVLWPDTTARARLRMVTEQGAFVSDTLLISPPATLWVDLNCADDLVLAWNAIAGATYSVRQYQKNTLTEVATTADTFLLIKKTGDADYRFSVQPTVRGKKSTPSLLIDTEQQGAGCYINSFLATLTLENAVDLRVNLSGVSRIDEVQIVKSIRGDAPQALEVFRPTMAAYDYEDTNPGVGAITYQLRVVTTSGDLYESVEVVVFSTDEANYLSFPNPVTDGYFHFLSPQTDALLQLIDGQGKVAREFDLINRHDEFFVGDLPEGIYLFQVIKAGKPLASGKLMVDQ